MQKFPFKKAISFLVLICFVFSDLASVAPDKILFQNKTILNKTLRTKLGTGIGDIKILMELGAKLPGLVCAVSVLLKNNPSLTDIDNLRTEAEKLSEDSLKPYGVTHEELLKAFPHLKAIAILTDDAGKVLYGALQGWGYFKFDEAGEPIVISEDEFRRFEASRQVAGTAEGEHPQPTVTEKDKAVPSTVVSAERTGDRVRDDKGGVDSQIALWEAKIPHLATESDASSSFVQEVLSTIPSKSIVLTLREGPTLLDVEPLVKAGHMVTATDFSPTAVQMLEREREDKGLSAVSTRQLNYDEPFVFDDESFNVVLSRLALGQYASTEQTLNTLQEIHRVLYNNGILIFQVKSTDDKYYGQGRQIAKDTFLLEDKDIKGREHLRHFWNQQSLVLLLQAAGFEVGEIKTSKEVL